MPDVGGTTIMKVFGDPRYAVGGLIALALVAIVLAVWSHV